jgi:hypothetical protein
MAIIRGNRIAEITTTTGIGDYVLSGALAGYFTFSSKCTIGDTVEYAADSIDATGDSEVGVGTFGAGNTLARTMVYSSSNANGAVNWAVGTKRIVLTLTAETLGVIEANTVRIITDATRLIHNQRILAQTVLRGVTP